MIGGTIASYLLSPPSKFSSPERNSHFNLVRDPQLNGVNDLLIIKTIPVTLYEILQTFRDTDIRLDLEGDLLKNTTNKNYKVDPVKRSDNKAIVCIRIWNVFWRKALGKKFEG